MKRTDDGEQYKRRNEIVRRMGFRSYKGYLLSGTWSRIREQVFRRDGGMCVVCCEPATEVHHVRYTEGGLRGIDLRHLVSVCHKCHAALEFNEDGNKCGIERARNVLRDALPMWMKPIPDEPAPRRKRRPNPPNGRKVKKMTKARARKLAAKKESSERVRIYMERITSAPLP